jgi:hypothetical protein
VRLVEAWADVQIGADSPVAGGAGAAT